MASVCFSASFARFASDAQRGDRAAAAGFLLLERAFDRVLVERVDTSGASPHVIFPPSALTFASELGTCLIQAMIFKLLLLVLLTSCAEQIF